jgi:hypothetical protein
MTYDVYSLENIDSYIFSSNLHACVSLFFGLFCIFVICRYSAKSMETGYRFHLLSITFWTLFCDLVTSFVLRPYPLLPMSGGCILGILPQFMAQRMQPELVSKLGLVSKIRIILTGWAKKSVELLIKKFFLVPKRVFMRKTEKKFIVVSVNFFLGCHGDYPRSLKIWG